MAKKITPEMDVPLILDRIRPKAKWRMAENYRQLTDTWEDEEQTLPTEEEIVDAWPATQSFFNKKENAPKIGECLEALFDASDGDSTKLDDIKLRWNEAKGG
jgi:hypothetical protein